MLRVLTLMPPKLVNRPVKFRELAYPMPTRKETSFKDILSTLYIWRYQLEQ